MKDYIRKKVLGLPFIDIDIDDFTLWLSKIGNIKRWRMYANYSDLYGFDGYEVEILTDKYSTPCCYCFFSNKEEILDLVAFYLSVGYTVEQTRDLIHDQIMNF